MEGIDDEDDFVIWCLYCSWNLIQRAKSGNSIGFCSFCDSDLGEIVFFGDLMLNCYDFMAEF